MSAGPQKISRHLLVVAVQHRQDIEDAEFLLQLDPPIEYICVSFVQKGQDLQDMAGVSKILDSDGFSPLNLEGNRWMINGPLIFFFQKNMEWRSPTHFMASSWAAFGRS